MEHQKVGPLVVGISGKKLNGKDKVAEYISNLLDATGITHSTIHFADPLKVEVYDAIRNADPIARHFIPESDWNQLVQSGTATKAEKVEWINGHKDVLRVLLQQWGTNFRRQLCGDDYWIKQFKAAVDWEWAAGASVILVPDLRFQNEMDCVDEMNGISIRVMRPGVCSNDPHPSECDLDLAIFDAVIVNDGDLESLRRKVKMVVESLILERI